MNEKKVIKERKKKQFILEIFNKKKTKKNENNETNTLIYFSPSLRVPLVGILLVWSVVLCRSFLKICVNMIASSI